MLPVADFYTEMQGVATELLTEFKQGVVTYIPLVAGTNDWDPKTDGTPIPLNATVRGAQKQYFSDLITQSDLQLNAAVFGTVPDNSGVVTIDGARRSVIKVEPIPAAGTTVAWLIFVKG